MSDSYVIQFSGPIDDPATRALLAWLAARGYSAQQTEILTRITVARPVVAALAAGDEGIDVSRHNWPVDFAAARTAGKRFAYIRASMGLPGGEYSGRDDKFGLHRQAARAAGLLDGAYHYFVWNLDGGLQADHFHKTVGGDPGALPPVVDVEPRESDTPAVVDRARSTLHLVGFINRLQALSGKAPVLYTSANAWARMTTEPEWIRNYLLWVADYASPLELPAQAAFAWMHQYRVAEAGELDWHPGRLDLDRYTGDDRPPTPPAAPPAPAHDLRDKTNQQVINLFNSVFGGLAELGRAVPDWASSMALNATVRQAPYSGPAIEEMPLTGAEKAALVAALGRSPA
ncbi:MAG: glycoside hydrolase family 25 protein [Anaerolineales bacterium]|nr:glycoside hydrolase family 25 protein [Anaerolineales bacterium]